MQTLPQFCRTRTFDAKFSFNGRGTCLLCRSFWTNSLSKSPAHLGIQVETRQGTPVGIHKENIYRKKMKTLTFDLWSFALLKSWRTRQDFVRTSSLSGPSPRSVSSASLRRGSSSACGTDRDSTSRRFLSLAASLGCWSESSDPKVWNLRARILYNICVDRRRGKESQL